MSINLKRERNNSFNLIGNYVYKRQKYLIRIWCSSRGLRSKDSTTHIWRIAQDPKENNENGVLPGARGFHGPFSEAKLKRVLNTINWTKGD